MCHAAIVESSRGWERGLPGWDPRSPPEVDDRVGLVSRGRTRRNARRPAELPAPSDVETTWRRQSTQNWMPRFTLPETFESLELETPSSSVIWPTPSYSIETFW